MRDAGLVVKPYLVPGSIDDCVQVAGLEGCQPISSMVAMVALMGPTTVFHLCGFCASRSRRAAHWTVMRYLTCRVELCHKPIQALTCCRGMVKASPDVSAYRPWQKAALIAVVVQAPVVASPVALAKLAFADLRAEGAKPATVCA